MEPEGLGVAVGQRLLLDDWDLAAARVFVYVPGHRLAGATRRTSPCGLGLSVVLF